MNSAKKTLSKLALGAVQFGLDYGVANQQGRIGAVEGRRILDIACHAGVDIIDTAIAYGNSEAALGNIGVRNWRIVSKLPAITHEIKDVEAWVESQVEGSLRRLNVARLDALLLHRPGDIFLNNGSVLPKALRKCQAQGLIGKVGVSIYSPDELPALLGAMEVDLVQAPLNLLDRRMVESGWMERLSSQGVEVHVRSIFLQGLLLLTAAQRPPQFACWQSLWMAWDSWLEQSRLSALDAAIRFAWNVAGVSKLVVGVDSAEHLSQILSVDPRPLSEVPDFSALVDDRLINPSVWNRL